MVNQDIIKDLIELRERIDTLIETLEIMSDEELMESIKKAKEQPPERNFKEFLREIGVDPLSMTD